MGELEKMPINFYIINLVVSGSPRIKLGAIPGVGLYSSQTKSMYTTTMNGIGMGLARIEFQSNK